MTHGIKLSKFAAQKNSKKSRPLINRVYTPQKTPGIISRKQMDRILEEVLAND